MDLRQLELSTEPFVLADLGVALKPVGFLGSGGDSIFASLFLDLPVPDWPHVSLCSEAWWQKCLIDSESDWLKQATSRDSGRLGMEALLLQKSTSLDDTKRSDWTSFVQWCIRMDGSNCAFHEGHCRVNFIRLAEQSESNQKILNDKSRLGLDWATWKTLLGNLENDSLGSENTCDSFRHSSLSSQALPNGNWSIN